jgi:predicted nucleic acid-binding Zn ribbon protein
VKPDAKKSLLRSWTGLPNEEIPKPRNLQEIFHKALRKLNLSDRLQESTLTDGWASIVGPTLSAHCRPGAIRQGKLMVHVDHPAWMHQIALGHKRNMLQSIQQAFPHLKVKEIVLRSG